MIIDLSKVSIFVRPGITDMRKQIYGLSILAEYEMKKDKFPWPFIDDFITKRKKIVKPLLDDLKSWLDKKNIDLRPTSNLGQWNKIY